MAKYFYLKIKKIRIRQRFFWGGYLPATCRGQVADIYGISKELLANFYLLTKNGRANLKLS